MKLTAARPTPDTQRGLAMLTALMILLFLTIAGGALLSNARVDRQIAVNYRTNAQLLFVTEAGIEAARETLRAEVESKINASAADLIDTLPEGISAVLTDYDGTDNLMSASIDIDTLLDTVATDDIRFADTVPVTAGGTTTGTYTIFLRNDAADGVTSNTDTNEVVTLVSIGVIDDSAMLIAVDVRKGRFPDLRAAMVLDGSVPTGGFGPGSLADFSVAGVDAAGGPTINGVGGIDNTSVTNIVDDIAAFPDRSDAYCGLGTTFPQPCNSGADTGPDVVNISGSIDPLLTTVTGVHSVVAGFEANATSTTCPSGATGAVDSPVIVVVNGDCTMSGTDTGWGTLIVKGALMMGGDVEWNGLVIVVDPAECDIASGGSHYSTTLAGGTVINGGLFIASSYNSTLSPVCINADGGGIGGVTYDSEQIRNGAQGLPFRPIAIRHY